MSDDTKSYEEHMKSKLSSEEIAQLGAEVLEEHKETFENLAKLEAEELEAAKLREANRAEFEQQKIIRAEYEKFIGDLKKKLKSHSKNKLVEIIGNQSWQFNQLQQLARQLHEENIQLKGEKPLGEQNA